MERIYIKNSIDKIDEEIILKGWVDNRRDHGKLIFIDLKDMTGIVQVVFLPDSSAYQKAKELRDNWVISLKGKVNKRPEKMINENIITGKIEIEAIDIEILNQSKTSPFDLNNEGYEIGEENRLKYRYLDLKRPRLQKNIRNRHKINQFIREYLTEKYFVEIETPIITKSTPEGARDFVVPSRIQKGKFYALPQSPQQYKQLLMVSGFEKYFQIARCFRDEDTRGDRQPEFTQLDIEMSFVEEKDILNLIENLFIELIKKLYPEKRIKEIPFPRISYQEAMKKYNSDKPDLRENKEDKNELAFVFVIDFPAFEWKENEKRWDATHHPFTMPKVKDIEDFEKQFKDNPEKILARQYDLALNGYEIAGGSIRIHKPDLLQKIFEVMGNIPERVKEKFGHLLSAFEYGIPPHGGIASGLDRVISILENEPNIREVIAFPKTGDARDLMMSSPSEIDKEQLDELGIEIKKE
jgi:aspartyl-tRNA synthetase